MVVPLDEDRHLGVEGTHMIIKEIVFVRGAELIESFGDLGLLRNGDVLPDLVVRQLHLCGDDAVGINGIAGMEQEVRAVLAHGGESKHAAIIGIDTPALSGNVAAPDEADVAPVARSSSNTPAYRSARNDGVREIAEPDAIENILPGWQIHQQQFCREIALRKRPNRL